MTAGDQVICRYSCLPFYRELEQDLTINHATMITPFDRHRYIASMNYYFDIEDLTFPTWFSVKEAKDQTGPFIVKGRTNSRKFQWNTLMYAETYKDIIRIHSELGNDPLIGTQGIVIRKYIPLETFEIGLNGMPMTNEWRVFFFDSKIIDYGYYWSCLDDLDKAERAKTDFEENGLRLAQEVADRMRGKLRFFVVDVAKTEEGRWLCVEMNDGQMSGLNMIDPESFYSKFAAMFK